MGKRELVEEFWKRRWIHSFNHLVITLNCHWVKSIATDRCCRWGYKMIYNPQSLGICDLIGITKHRELLFEVERVEHIQGRQIICN